RDDRVPEPGTGLSGRSIERLRTVPVPLASYNGTHEPRGGRGVMDVLEMATMMTRTLATLTVLAHVTLAPAPTLAQQTATPTSQTAGPVVQLTMAQAEAMALESNLQLKVDRMDPALADETLASARAVFNPTLGSS